MLMSLSRGRLELTGSVRSGLFFVLFACVLCACIYVCSQECGCTSVRECICMCAHACGSLESLSSVLFTITSHLIYWVGVSLWLQLVSLINLPRGSPVSVTQVPGLQGAHYTCQAFMWVWRSELHSLWLQGEVLYPLIYLPTHSTFYFALSFNHFPTLHHTYFSSFFFFKENKSYAPLFGISKIKDPPKAPPSSSFIWNTKSLLHKTVGNKNIS